ncbi:MAG TPA: CPBP family intramembrane metalloprotease, partial [Leptospiraceae bacterium]|nr:CPBP family intramembrane metalloprotease [Leptospiraceae bacterium]
MKQLSVFFGLAFLISWIIWLPLWGVYFGMNLPVLPYHHGLGGLGPIIASFLTTWIFPGKESV